MFRKVLATGLFLALALGAAGVQAHHSFAAEFVREPATIDGVVTEVWFKNPHIRYYVEVTNEDGTKEVWDTRGQSPTALRRASNWRRNSINVGDHVIMDGFLGRDGRKLLSIKQVTLDDGTVLVPRESSDPGYADDDKAKDQ